MEKRIIVDAHCDSLQVALDKNISLDNKQLSFNTKEAIKKTPYIQFLASYISTKYEKQGFKRVNDMLDKFYMENTEDVICIKKPEQIDEVISKSKLGIILSIENGIAIDMNLDNIDKLYKRGIRVMGITWNDDNYLGCGAHTKNDKGLTNLGKKYINKLEDRNILIDVSHCSYKTMFDTINISTKPVIATHSCVYNICNHPRNLLDEQIKEIAKSGGVIGICFCKEFLTNKNIANVDDLIKHIEYIVDLVGIEYVGIGTDFDGINDNNFLDDIKGVKDIEKLFTRLENRGYSKRDIDKIAGGNIIRILKEAI